MGMHEQHHYEPEPKKLNFFERQYLTIIMAFLGPNGIDAEDLRAMRAQAGVLDKFETPVKKPGFPNRLSQYLSLLGERRMKIGPQEKNVLNTIDREAQATKDKNLFDSYVPRDDT